VIEVLVILNVEDEFVTLRLVDPASNAAKFPSWQFHFIDALTPVLY
jgi:hypothetical protein